MSFNFSSYLAGVGTVMVTLALGFSSGTVLLDSLGVDSARVPNRLESRGLEDAGQPPPAQLANATRAGSPTDTSPRLAPTDLGIQPAKVRSIASSPPLETPPSPVPRPAAAPQPVVAESATAPPQPAAQPQTVAQPGPYASVSDADLKQAKAVETQAAEHARREKRRQAAAKERKRQQNLEAAAEWVRQQQLDAYGYRVPAYRSYVQGW